MGYYMIFCTDWSELLEGGHTLAVSLSSCVPDFAPFVRAVL